MLRRRAVIGVAGLALAVAMAAGAAAGVPEGPRLAVLKATGKPNRAAIVTLSPSGENWRRVVAARSAQGRRLGALSGPAWSADGSTLAFAHFRPRMISVVPARGGPPRTVPGTRGGYLPVLSPDGRSLAFTRTLRKGLRRYRWGNSWAFESSSVWVVDLETGERRQLTRWRHHLDHYASSFSPDGSTLLVVRWDVERSQDQELLALRFDDRASGLLVGEGALPAYSPDGSRIALFRTVEHRIRARPGEGSLVTVAADGTRRWWRVLENSELYLVDADGSHLRRLTHTPRHDEYFASWDPSGERIAYSRFRRGGLAPSAVMQINADGSCPTTILSSHRLALLDPAWQPGPGREAGRIDC